MWLFTTQGFYSVVAHRDDPETLIVRARTRARRTAQSWRCRAEISANGNLSSVLRHEPFQLCLMFEARFDVGQFCAAVGRYLRLVVDETLRNLSLARLDLVAKFFDV